MNRYEIREKGRKTGPLSTNIFDLESIKQDIEMLHYYDTKLNQLSKYEVYDNKLKKVIWEEQ